MLWLIGGYSVPRTFIATLAHCRFWNSVYIFGLLEVFEFHLYFGSLYVLEFHLYFGSLKSIGISFVFRLIGDFGMSS